MDLTILKNIGLTDGEIKIYEALLEGGELPANEIIVRSSLKKGDCYNKIYDLLRRGFVEELTGDKKKHFRLAHPQMIENYIHDRLSAITDTQREINALLPGILSTYNLTYHKPGVKYFEGEEALNRIVEDSLTAETEIYSYVDSEAVDKFLPDLNKEYKKRRKSLLVKKKIIVADTLFYREHFKNIDKAVTEVRFVKHDLTGFSTNVMMYDNKISYMTMQAKSNIGIIIEDHLISKLHRTLFEYNWNTASE